jgi:hypothetical protein
MILETGGCASDGIGRKVGCALRALTFAFAALVSVAHAAIGYSVRSDIDRKLFRIDLATGIATELGDTNFSKIEALAINAAGELYGVNPQSAQLVRCNTASGACTAVGTLTGIPPASTNVGLTFDANARLVMAINAVVYVVDPATGTATVVGAAGSAISGLASGNVSASCASGLYGIGGNSDQGKFYCINATSGAATQIATLSSVSALDGGLDGDRSTGLIWGITNGTASQIYAVDPATLVVSNTRAVTVGGAPAGGFESLAVQPSAAASGIGVPMFGHAAWLLILFGSLLARARIAIGVRPQA